MTAEGDRRSDKGRTAHPIRGAIARGLGVVLPPLLTIVIFLWIGGTVDQYVLDPVIKGAQALLIHWKADIRTDDDLPGPVQGRSIPVVDGVEYQRLASGDYVPKAVYDLAVQSSREEPVPRTGTLLYGKYFRATYLRPYLVIPCFLFGFTLVLYLLGKFMAAGIGRFFWALIEGGIERVPLVRNVYSSVKQVSGFLLNQRQMRISRVVAVEYPRQGMWAMAFVTSEGMPPIEEHAGEECITVLIPSSPTTIAGYTIIVRRSEVIDLNITADQAIQFIASCGVVVPQPRSARGARPANAPSVAKPASPCITSEQ